MKEVRGNLWTYPAHVRVITTNGFVKNDGKAVMGRGCALEATKLYPDISLTLGNLLKKHGNHVNILRFGEFFPKDSLVSFPVKHHWYQEADLQLIERSCQELVALAGNYDHSTVFVLPRPGCGNGKLSWADVKPVLEQYFDDRFHVITF